MASLSSLGRQISWKVGASVAVTILVIVVLLCAAIWKPEDNSVFRSVANEAADAVIRTSDGTLLVNVDKLPVEFGLSSAWLYAKHADGRHVSYGRVPDAYIVLMESNDVLREADIRASDPRMAASVVMQMRESGRLHVVTGGIGGRPFLRDLMPVLVFASILLVIPAATLLMLVIPPIVRSALGGVRVLAEQAGRIDLERRGLGLDTRQVPIELEPLIQAFNRALDKMWTTLEARERFLSNAAHELRIPVTIIRTRVSALPEGPSKVALTADVARLQNIAEQLLDIQRIEHTVVQRQQLDLTEVAREVAEDYAPLLLGSGYTLSFDAAEAPVMISGDKGALQRVLANLLQNAIVHGGGRGEIVIAVEQGASMRVSDSGPGVPKEFRSQIFAPFFRLNTNSEGSGLGLHLASEIVRLHGGRIEIRESEMGGACFAVHLPAEPSA